MSRLRSSCKEGKEDERDKRKVRQDSTGQCGANDRAKYPKSNHVLSCVSRSAVLVRVYHPSLISSSMCRPLRVALLHRRRRCRARIICGWSWKEAIGRTTKEWTGLDWAHAASGVFCDALPSSSPLAFALLELGRHLINLYLAFTQIRMAISLNSLCLCPESCWLKCITQYICTLALLHCPEHTCTVCQLPQHLIGSFAPCNGQSGLQQDPSPTARTN
jgi:hypothetical protein